MRTLISVVLVAALAVGTSSCCFFKGTCAKDLSKDLIECGKVAAKAEFLDVVEAVTQILAGDKVDWAKQLKDLENNSFEGAVCAVAAVEDYVRHIINPLTSAPTVVAKAAPTKLSASVAKLTPAQKQQIVARAEAYLQLKGKQIKNVP
jgi:hypothetical protein